MRFLKRLSALVAALALLVPMPGASAKDSLAEAKARVEAARRTANEASQRYEEASSRYYELDGDIRRTRQTLSVLDERAGALRAVARERAIEAYKGKKVDLSTVVAGDDVLDAVRRTELLSRVNASGDSALDELGALSEELDIRETDLAQRLEQQAAVVDDLKARERELYNALASAEKARKELEARIEAQNAAARASRASRASRADGGGPSGRAGQIIVNPGGGNFACPVQGAVAFSDTWGAPRSGGRRHQGVDMMAGYGTPLVAVVSGSINQRNSGLGGRAIYLRGSNGTTYYYAHLQSWVGGSRSVSAGELIGTVGDTGNARGTPHLHFEIHPGGGGAVNPYPTVRQYC